MVERDRSQAEVVLTIDQYVQRRLTRTFVRTARRTGSGRIAPSSSAIAKKYGVPSSLIVAIWGMESNFGRFTGTRPVMQALATLAWEGRRRAFFTAELINALQILDKGYIEPERMKGSWAGAMGQTQFMPSSYLAHAQDYDGDGRRDIWGTLPDVFASIANYMTAYGWKNEQTWGREVKVPAGGATKLAACGRVPPERLPRGARADRAGAAGEVAGAGRADGRRQGAAEGRSVRVAAARRREILPGLRQLRRRCSATTARTPTRWRWACCPTVSTKIRVMGTTKPSAALVTRSWPWRRWRWRRACISAATDNCRWR